MKRFAAVIIALAMVLTAMPAFAADEVKVYIDGALLEGAEAEIVSDRTYLPVRAICEAVGKDVDWNDETRSVIVGEKPGMTKGAGSVNIYVDGALLEGAEALIISDRTYLPVRALCESIGMEVEWVDETRSVYITTPGEAPDALDGGFFRLKHEATGFYLSVENASRENGAKIVVAANSDNSNQVWGFTAVGDGYYKVYNQNTGKSIDVASQNTEKGHDIEQYTINGGANQLVKAVENADGSYTFIFKHSLLALTATERYTTQEEPVCDKTQSFTAEYVGKTPMAQLRGSEGYKALDEKTRERFEAYVFSPLSFSATVAGMVENEIISKDYYSLSAAEQAEILKGCLKFTAYSGVLTYGEVRADKENAKYEVISKEYEASYDVWRGTMLPVWKYKIKMDGDAEGQVHEWTLVSTVEDSPAVDDAINAISRFPYAVRKFMKTLVYRVDSANNYNGGDDTIWIRLSYNPGENAYAQSLAHELGHVLDRNLTSDRALWDRAIENDMVPISGYGNSNRDEDLAEFSRLYHMVKRSSADLAALEKVYPNRFAAYAALLYSADSEYYAQYKSCYEKSMAFDDDDKAALYCTVGIPGTDLVLTATDAGTKGSVVTFEKSTGDDSQVWRIRTLNGKKALFNRKSGLCLNVPGNSVEAGKNLIVWNGGKGDNELTEMSESGGMYSFKFSHSGLYLGYEKAEEGAKAVQTSLPAELSLTTKMYFTE